MIIPYVGKPLFAVYKEDDGTLFACPVVAINGETYRMMDLTSDGYIDDCGGSGFVCLAFEGSKGLRNVKSFYTDMYVGVEETDGRTED